MRISQPRLRTECSGVDGLRKVASTPVPWRANEQPWRDSARVLLRRMIGARDPAGFLVNQTSTGLRISKELVFNGQLVRDVLSRPDVIKPGPQLEQFVLPLEL